MMRLTVVSAVLLISAAACAQETYRLPPSEVVDIIDVPPEPAVSLSPDRKWMLLIDRSAMPSIEDVSRRMLRLAGMRIDPAANSRFRSQFDTGLGLRSLQDESVIRIPLPETAKLGTVSWSHDSKTVAYVVVTKTGSQLWVASVDDPARPTA